MQDCGIQYGCMELKMAISQLRLYIESEYFRFYGSIGPMGFVKLPSFYYLLKIQDGDI